MAKEAGLSADKRFEALMRLVDHHRLRIDGRRDQRWRLSLAGWGAMLGAVAIVRVPLEPRVVVLALVGAVILHAVFLAGLIAKDLPDREAREAYLQRAQQVLGLREDIDVVSSSERQSLLRLAGAVASGQYSAWFQLGVTVAIATLTAATLGEVATTKQSPAAAIAASPPTSPAQPLPNLPPK